MESSFPEAMHVSTMEAPDLHQSRSIQLLVDGAAFFIDGVSRIACISESGF